MITQSKNLNDNSRDLSTSAQDDRGGEILSPDGSRMTRGDNAKYILCHSGTSESEVMQSKKKRDLSTTLKMTAERSFDCAQHDRGRDSIA